MSVWSTAAIVLVKRGSAAIADAFFERSPGRDGEVLAGQHIIQDASVWAITLAEASVCQGARKPALQ